MLTFVLVYEVLNAGLNKLQIILCLNIYKAKYEAAGIQIDNEQKQRKVQQEADAELVKELVAEEGEADTPRLDELQVKGFEKGEPDSMTRRGFIDACRAVIALPAQLAANSSRRQPKG